MSTYLDVTSVTENEADVVPYEIDRANPDISAFTEVGPDLSKLAHVVNIPMNAYQVGRLHEKGWVVKSPQDLVDGARHYSIAVQAICGYIWVPTERPGQHDVCQDCMDTAARWIGEDE